MLSISRSTLVAASAAARRAAAPAAAASVSAAARRHLSSAGKAPKKPLRVTLTGAAGAISYSTAFRIASGQMLGPDQPVILQLLELPGAPLAALEGVKMELQDCAFPLLKDVICTSDADTAFGDADHVLLVGARPRGPGMERKDLLSANGKIFTAQGASINRVASRNVKVIVVGNPANTNCLIAASNAPDIPRENFSAMTRLDLNRAIAQVALKTGAAVTEVDRVIIWGNHSATQYPDLSHATVRGQPAKQVIKDDAWVKSTFIPDVQQRGAAIIKARGASSAASAGGAAIDHMRDWFLGTQGKWTSMAVPSDGSYGIPEGVFYSYPVTCEGGKWKIVQGLSVDEFSRGLMDKTKKELFEERDAVKDMLR